jgi:hypothetical protein
LRNLFKECQKANADQSKIKENQKKTQNKFTLKSEIIRNSSQNREKVNFEKSLWVNPS